MGTLIVNQYLSGLDSDAATYIAAVEAADGQTLEGATKRAINDFVVGCKADGIWDAIKTSCILAGARTLAGALTPLVGTAPTNFNFVAGDYDRKTGLKGNGTNKYLNSNQSNTIVPQNDAHISFYTPIANANQAAGGYLGNGINQVGTFTLFSRETDFVIRCKSSTANTGLSIPISNTFAGASRSLSTSYTYRRNGASETINTTSDGSLVGDIYVFAANNWSGGIGAYATCSMSFYSIGTSVDLALLDARVTQLMTDINNAF